MEHKMSCKGTGYDWQQKEYKEELVHAFLTLRLTMLWNTLPICGISLTWSINAMSKFPGKRYVEKEFKGYQVKLFASKSICYHKYY